MIDPNAEINRLRDLMPATGRMKTRLKLSDDQPRLIAASVPRPWRESHPISLNLTLWEQLTQPQRDLLFLRTVCWTIGSNLMQPDWYQGLMVTGVVGAAIELARGEAVGLLLAGSLATAAGLRIWRSSRGVKVEMAADDKALEVAQRRGYTAAQAAQALSSAIEAAARIEGRSGLSTDELIRCQNLRATAGLAPNLTSESSLQR